MQTDTALSLSGAIGEKNTTPSTSDRDPAGETSTDLFGMLCLEGLLKKPTLAAPSSLKGTALSQSPLRAPERGMMGTGPSKGHRL